MNENPPQIGTKLVSQEILTSVRWDGIKPEERFGLKNENLFPLALEKLKGLNQWLNDKGLNFLRQRSVFRGGQIIAPYSAFFDKETRDFLGTERSLAVIPIRSLNSEDIDSVLHYPSKPELIHFSANLNAYRDKVASIAEENWDATLGSFPIPKAKYSERINDGFITQTEYKHGISSLGMDGPINGVHQLDTRKISDDEVRQLVHVMDKIHIDSSEILENGYEALEESWLNKKNKKSFLRSGIWWIHEGYNDDRLTELTKHIKSVKKDYEDFDSKFDFEGQLETMIRNNLPLYRNQDGTTNEEDRKFLADTVVAHGTVFADNIHIRRRPNGKIDFTITGGDRCHFGLRGESIDALVSGCASNPDYMKALVEEFKKIQMETEGRDVKKEMRGLAMHVMYRCISEIPWYISKGKKIEAQNLMGFTRDILQGNGIWEGVNIDIRDVKQ